MQSVRDGRRHVDRLSIFQPSNVADNGADAHHVPAARRADDLVVLSYIDGADFVDELMLNSFHLWLMTQ